MPSQRRHMKLGDIIDVHRYDADAGGLSPLFIRKNLETSSSWQKELRVHVHIVVVWSKWDKRRDINETLVLLHCGEPTYIQGEGVCWGDTFSPTDTSWEASLPYTIDHMFISQHSPLINLSSVYCNPKTPSKKTLWEKLRRNIITICHRKLLQKPSGKNIRRNHMTYVRTCIFIVSLKTLYEKP
jgi:hypothetical protein